MLNEFRAHGVQSRLSRYPQTPKLVTMVRSSATKLDHGASRLAELKERTGRLSLLSEGWYSLVPKLNPKHTVRWHQLTPHFWARIGVAMGVDTPGLVQGLYATDPATIGERSVQTTIGKDLTERLSSYVSPKPGLAGNSFKTPWSVGQTQFILDSGFFFPSPYRSSDRRAAQLFPHTPDGGLGAMGASRSFASAQTYRLMQVAAQVRGLISSHVGGTVNATDARVANLAARLLSRLKRPAAGVLHPWMSSFATLSGGVDGGVKTPLIFSKRRGSPTHSLLLPTKVTPPARVGTWYGPRSRALSGQLATQIAGMSGEVAQTNLDFDFRSLTFSFKQPHVRYKPGFMAYWRHHRRVFKACFSAPWMKRQRPMTRYVAKLWRVAGFSHLKLAQLTVRNVLAQSHLSGSMGETKAPFVSYKGWVSVNGKRLPNHDAQLYTGDFVLLPADGGAFSSWGSGRFMRPWPVWKLSQWVDYLSKKKLDTPQHLEVDELCRGLIILYEPTEWLAYVTQTDSLFPFLTFKLYNWKYIV